MAIAPKLDEHNAAYLEFLKRKVREGLRERLMAVAAKEIDEVVDDALESLDASITTYFMPESQKQFVDVIIKKRVVKNE